jgi:hypothetical protein
MNYAIDTLTKEYQNWIKENELPNLSADELAVETRTDEHGDEELIVNSDQRLWLNDFISRWEKVDEEKAITHEPQDKDAWVCICGNMPSESGFFPIDEENHEVEPTPEDWKTNQYFCNQCGRVIDQETLEVVRKLDPATVVKLA